MLRCRASFSSFRMLSSSSNPNPSFLCITTPTSTSSLSPQFPNPNISLSNSNPHLSPPPPQSMSPSKCFSATSNPITVSKTSESTSADFEAIESSSQPLVVVSFYKFADFPRHADMRKPLKDLCELLRVSGGIILAPEGINGSICGIRESVEKVLQFIQTDKHLKGLRQVESPVSPEEEAIHHGHSSSSPLAAGEDAPFRWDHVRVKLKKEVVIDVRNDYETRIGRFKGAVDPRTTAFRKFPSWVDDQFQLAEPEAQVELDHLDGSTEHNIENQGQKIPPRVAMYCTGGIRCEKASSFLLSKGFKEVYHLEGGILKYLEEVPKTESLWEGECFVFDKRVSVDHGLVQGTFKLCYGCKQPVSDADMEAPEWEYGVSCPHCYSSKSEEEKERARARQRQFETWGIIGGPDKGRPPARTIDGIQGVNQVSKSL
ncbi:hypothetical protein CsSME_00028868 [Camellia sinensis var. sinensis]